MKRLSVKQKYCISKFLYDAEANNDAEWECGDRESEDLAYFNLVQVSINKIREVMHISKNPTEYIKHVKGEKGEI